MEGKSRAQIPSYNRSSGSLDDRNISNEEPEFLIRRNLILQKRSLSRGSDTDDSLASDVNGALKSNHKNKIEKGGAASCSQNFKGVQLHGGEKTGSSLAYSHSSPYLLDEKVDRIKLGQFASSGATIKSRSDANRISTNGYDHLRGSSVSPITTPSPPISTTSGLHPRHHVDVFERSGSQSPPWLAGLPSGNTLLRRKMGEDSGEADNIIQTAREASGSSPDPDISERHLAPSPNSEESFFKPNLHPLNHHPNGLQNINSAEPTIISNGVDLSLGSKKPMSEQEPEFSYGPGFVDKLKSRFISLSIQEASATGNNPLRRSSSLELLDGDVQYPVLAPEISPPISEVLVKRKRTFGVPYNRSRGGVGSRLGAPLQQRNSFKRAKSMETLTLDSERKKMPCSNGESRSLQQHPRPFSMIETVAPGLGLINENLVIIDKTESKMTHYSDSKVAKKKQEGNNRLQVMSSIDDEELPKPDTVKTCKLIFEKNNGEKKKSGVIGNGRSKTALLRSAKNHLNLNRTNANSFSSVVSPTASPGLRSKLTSTVTPLLDPTPVVAMAKPKLSAKDSALVNGNVPEALDKVNGSSLKPKESPKDAPKEAPGSKDNFKGFFMPLKKVVIENGDCRDDELKTNDGLSETLRVRQNLNKVTPKAPSPSEKTSASFNLPKNTSKNLTNGGEVVKGTIAQVQIDALTPLLNHVQLSSVKPPVSNANATRVSDMIPEPALTPPPELTPKTAVIENILPPPVKLEPTQPKISSLPPSKQTLSLTNNASLEGPVSSPPQAVISKPKEVKEKETIIAQPIKPPAAVGNSHSTNATSPESKLKSPEAPVNDAEAEVLKPSTLLGNKKSGLWGKAPPPMNNTVVFDFRGKEVETHLSKNPAPFGCKPARPKKKKSQHPRSSLEGDGKLSLNNGTTLNLGDWSGSSKDYSDSEEEDEDFDTIDIGSQLPAASGIVFLGENVKCNKSSLLVTKNKMLKLQFDDGATSTFEYPSDDWIYEELNGDTATGSNQEMMTPPQQQGSSVDGDLSSPSTEDSSSLSSMVIVPSTGLRNAPGIGSTVSGLSNYTPIMLTSNESFQLGVSRAPAAKSEPQSSNEDTKSVTDAKEEELLPADANETSSWSSSTSTSDLLF